MGTQRFEQYDEHGDLVHTWDEDAPEDPDQPAVETATTLDPTAAAALTAQVKAAVTVPQMRTAVLALIDQISP